MMKKILLTIVVLLALSGLTQAGIVTIQSEGVTIRTGSLNQQTSGRMIVGDVSLADVIRGTCLFSLNDPLLVDATINSVTVTVVPAIADGGSESAEDFTIHECQSFANTEVTWTKRDASIDWTTPGGDYGAVLDTKRLDPRSATPAKPVIFSGEDLTAAVANNLGGTFYSLFKIVDESDGNRDLVQFKDQVTLTIDYTAVPEPATMLLLGMGAVTLVRRKK